MNKTGKSNELLVANKELAFQIAENKRLGEVLVIAKQKLTSQNEEKEKRDAELIIANNEKAKRAAELIIAKKEKAKRKAELVVADLEKSKRATELIIADEEKANRAAELVIADLEKSKLAAELVIADVEKAKRSNELVIAKEEKAKRAADLIIEKAEKAKRAAALVIANAEKAKRAAELVIANLDKDKRAGELIIADKELIYQNKEKVKRAAELVIADVNKTKRKAELVIANVEKAKLAAELVWANKELSFQTEEIARQAAEFAIADADKAKRAAELLIANIRKAKRAAEFVIANVEKAKRSAELVIANKELVYQNSEKAKRAAELIIANVEKAKLAAELIIANIEKAKRAAELVIANRDLDLAKEKEKLVVELITANKELSFQIRERTKREDELIILNTILDHQNKEKVKQAAELIKAKDNAEKSDRLKSAFLTNMSHEIRTPMNGILGFSALLKEPNLTGEEQQEYIRIIQISGNRLLNTINNIVDISKIESGLINVNIESSNINDQIEFIYNFFKLEAESKGLRIFSKCSLPWNEAIIETDIEKLYSVLTNLVKNAIKFTNYGSIELGYILKSDKKAAVLEFFVKDTGVGISIKQKEIIFDRFRQGNESLDRNYEGSGLGLSISKSYLEMLGGKLWVESEVGKGSVFYFTIPYISKTEKKIITKNAISVINKNVQNQYLKILVAEDDDISYSLLYRILQDISKEVIHVKTGVEALGSYKDNPDIDLILMDIRMPDMDGYEATRQIRLNNKEVIIIAQTAYGFSEDTEKAIEAGCNDCITKPINKTLLYELINNYFKN